MATGLVGTAMPASGQEASSSSNPSIDEPVAPSGAGSGTFEGAFSLRQLEARDAAGGEPVVEADHFAGALPQGDDPAATEEQQAEREAVASTEEAAPADAAEPEPADTDPNAPPGTFIKLIDGIDQQAGGCAPPDSDGAIGGVHYVEIVNCRARVYRKSDSAMVMNVTLQSLFSDPDFVFDPRMVYDQTYKRFVGLVTRRADSGTDTNRYFKIAVTTASNGQAVSWMVYRVNFSGINGEWCDYPQLGLGQDEILVTCNNFDDANGGFERVIVMAIPKARAYNGWGFNFPIFQPADTFSLAPPVLVGTPQQQNDNLYFLQADDANDQVDIWRMNAGAHPGQTSFVKQANIAVPAWSQPFDAFNCGGGGPTNAPTTVDALEGRFQQNSWQNDNSNSLWNVHSEAIGGFITPVYFQINTVTNTVTRRGVIDANTGADEFNAVLTVNGADEVFATWNETDDNINTCLNIRRGGCQVAAGDCDANIGDTSGLHKTGAGPINNIDGIGRNRWGDYSSIEPDPQNYGAGCSANKSVWASIESTDENDGLWDNRLFHFGFAGC